MRSIGFQTLLLMIAVAGVVAPGPARSAPPAEAFLCYRDSDCDAGELCELETPITPGVCVPVCDVLDCRQIGESCDGVLNPCDQDLSCRLDPRDPLDPLARRCFPDVQSVDIGGGGFDWEDDEACLDWWSEAEHYAAPSEAISYARVIEAAAVGTVTYEYGAVYASRGEYGCYETICGGTVSNASIGTAVSVGEYLDYDKFSGLSSALVFGAGITPVALSRSEIFDVPDASNPRPPILIGEAMSVGISASFVPLDGAALGCSTNLNIVVRNFAPDTNDPPVADAGPDQSIECSSPDGALATLDGSGSFDPDGEIVEYFWTNSLGTADGPTPTIALPIGTETTTLVVTDDEGAESEPDTVDISVQDTVPPEVELTADPSVLWPPNRKMVPVRIEADATDTCDDAPACMITDVRSSEGRMRRADWEIDGELSLKLRAKRKGKGPGRTYTIDVECSDAAGNISTTTTEVLVPHDQSGRDRTNRGQSDENPPPTDVEIGEEQDTPASRKAARRALREQRRLERRQARE